MVVSKILDTNMTFVGPKRQKRPIPARIICCEICYCSWPPKKDEAIGDKQSFLKSSFDKRVRIDLPVLCLSPPTPDPPHPLPLFPHFPQENPPPAPEPDPQPLSQRTPITACENYPGKNYPLVCEIGLWVPKTFFPFALDKGCFDSKTTYSLLSRQGSLFSTGKYKQNGAFRLEPPMTRAKRHAFQDPKPPSLPASVEFDPVVALPRGRRIRKPESYHICPQIRLDFSSQRVISSSQCLCLLLCTLLKGTSPNYEVSKDMHALEFSPVGCANILCSALCPPSCPCLWQSFLKFKSSKPILNSLA